MQVAICDDQKVFRDQIKQIISAYKRIHRSHIDVYEFEKGEDLLTSDKVFDLVFLDHQMPGLNGIDTAQKLRLVNPICSIIFVTSFPEHCILDAFTVQTFRFLVKPIEENKVIETLESYVKQQKLLKPLVVWVDSEMITINPQDIVYLEADGKYCWVRTTTNTYHSSKTLSQITEMLPIHCFYRVHHSFCVNMYYIFRIDGCEITLINGEKSLISRPNRATFIKAYHQFIQDYYVGM